MFGKQAYELLQEVAQCPADNLPAFNVSCSKRRRAPAPSFSGPCSELPILLQLLTQEEGFRSIVDEVHLQHERLTSVYK